MKKYIFSSLALLSMLSLGLLFIEGCKLKNPTEGVTIGVKADAVTAPSELIIRDAKTGSPIANLTTSVPVSISGPGAPYVYNSGAGKQLSLFEGAIPFSLRRGTPVSIDNPIKFTIFINIPGYLPLEYPITLTSLTPISAEAYVVSFENPPAGAGSGEKTVGTGSDGKTTDTSSIVIPASADKTETLKIAIAAGTQMLGADGAPVSGPVEAKVIQFSPAQEESLNSFPGGLELNELEDANGNKLEGGGIEPAGWINMNMSAGGKSVKSFDKPLETTIEINKDQINPKTNAKFKAGDELDVYSKTEGEDNWVKEGTALVKLNTVTGNLEATMQVTHLSTWAMGIFIVKCGEKLKITVNLENDFAANDFKIYKSIFVGGQLVEQLVYSFTFDFLVDGGGNVTRTLDFIPQTNSNYIIKNMTEGTTIFTGLLCGTPINIGTLKPTNRITNTLLLSCQNGTKILLPKDYNVYFILETDYQSTINPFTNRKIDPRDPIVAGKDWKEVRITNTRINGVETNQLIVPKSQFIVGQVYRFSLYYNDGKKESRRDYISEAYDGANTKTVPITIADADCPI